MTLRRDRERFEALADDRRGGTKQEIRMRKFSRQTPDGRTIAAEPDLRRHVAQPPPRAPAADAAERADGSALVAFVAGSIAALPEQPRDDRARLCLQLFLLGAADAFWRRHDLPVAGATHVLSRLLERHGLPGSETAGLIEALPQLRQDAGARRILRQGDRAMAEYLANHDPNLFLQMQELVQDWRRRGLWRHDHPSAGGIAPQG
jgi:hypothetical protein